MASRPSSRVAGWQGERASAANSNKTEALQVKDTCLQCSKYECGELHSLWNEKDIQKNYSKRKLRHSGPNRNSAQGHREVIAQASSESQSLSPHFQSFSPGSPPRQELQSSACHRTQSPEGHMWPASAGLSGYALLPEMAREQAGNFLKPS